MKIAIIGAGFSGLSAGYYLAKKGCKVTIFEREKVSGGLAVGYKKENWAWPLEHYYHHLFISDQEIIKLAKDLGIKINFYKSKTSTLTNKGIYPLDSLTSLLKFPNLDFISKLRTGVILGYFKITPFWKSLEKITVKSFVLKTMGTKSWKFIWQPLLDGKFGKYADKIPASWLWARIKKRSVYLGYPDGGFDSLAKRAASAIEKLGGKILYNTEVLSPQRDLGRFDKVVSTIPAQKLTYFGAISLILRLSKPFLPKEVYWLNIGVKDFSFLSIVEHTNLIPKYNYNNEHIVYVGKYLPANHKYFSLTKDEILQEYDKDLTKICPNYKSSLIGLDVFKTPYAQPIIPLNYSLNIPPIRTGVGGLYAANMEQIYPWDRGTNYAVALGKRVAQEIIKQK